MYTLYTVYPFTCGATRPKNTHFHFMPLIFNPRPPRHPVILHQPPETQKYVIFPILPQNLNGISVSGPPFFGERPYPRQFHPVEMTPIFANFRPQTCESTSYQPRKIPTKPCNNSNPHIHIPPPTYQRTKSIIYTIIQAHKPPKYTQDPKIKDTPRPKLVSQHIPHISITFNDL